MKNLILSFIIFCFNKLVHSQQYYLSDDSVVFRVNLNYIKDSLQEATINVENKSSRNLFLCSMKFRKHPMYINTIDGQFVFGCGCEYGFNQDYDYRLSSLDVIKINSHDSLVFKISGFNISGKKITKKDVLERDKVFSFNYVLSNSFLIFHREERIHEEFNNNKRRFFVIIKD
jgi:hypothetical protein